jgi:Ni/Fe-hydrogenase subunit HybB-like protein
VGAVHSGLGMVVIGMYLVRKYYRLEEYIRREHFDKMGKLLVVTTLTLAYLYFSELLTVWYAKVPDENTVMYSMITGPFARPWWIMIAMIYVIPLLTLTIPSFRRWPFGIMVVGVLINIGMYIERMLILVPPLAHPRLPYSWGSYFPSAVELLILLGSLAFAVLLYLLASKFVPMISIWEEKEGRLHGRRPE